MKRQPTIGLEVHVELTTRTKMFCDSANNPDGAEPNSNVCPVCMAHPGTLPSPNKEAIMKVLLLGKALQGNIADFAQFDRKNYFYPDLPKWYQISQYKYPLVVGGSLAGVSLRRIHLEEDTAKTIHDESGSLIDYNRAGIPLMELVTEPDITGAEQARGFAKELHSLLRYLDISDADMEKGQMRIEANVSMDMGTKTEIKNLNSFRSVHDAIEHEIARQSRLLDAGESPAQETMGWNESSGATVAQRIKEESHDYRYIPEPDIPPLDLREFASALELPEMPDERINRMVDAFGLQNELAVQIVSDKPEADFFEEVAQLLGDKKLARTALNYITSDLRSLGAREKALSASDFADLVRMIGDGTVSSRGAKDILGVMVSNGGNPRAIAASRGLTQRDDLAKTAEDVISANPAAAADYARGKAEALKYLVGRGMAATNGSANPEKLTEEIKKQLKRSKVL